MKKPIGIRREQLRRAGPCRAGETATVTSLGLARRSEEGQVSRNGIQLGNGPSSRRTRGEKGHAGLVVHNRWFGPACKSWGLVIRLWALGKREVQWALGPQNNKNKKTVKITINK